MFPNIKLKIQFILHLKYTSNRPHYFRHFDTFSPQRTYDFKNWSNAKNKDKAFLFSKNRRISTFYFLQTKAKKRNIYAIYVDQLLLNLKLAWAQKIAM